MAKLLTIEAIGMKDMQATIKLMNKYGSSIQGVEFLGDKRGKTNNAEIIQFHKKGIKRKHGGKTGLIVRDITANDADRKKAAEKFSDKLMKVLAKRYSHTTESLLAKIANSALAQGLKAGANVIRRAMLKRLDTQTDNSGKALESVTMETRKQRLKRSGIPGSYVLRDTGNLLSNLSRTAYKFTKKK